MAIAVDSVGSIGVLANSSGTLSFNNVAGDLMVVGIAIEVSGAVTVGTCTYAGASLTKASGIQQTAGAPDKQVELWYKIAPATGANNLIVSVSTTADLHIGAVSVTGAHQTTPLNTAGSAVNTSASPSVVLTSTVDGVMFFDIESGEGGVGTVGAGQTKRWNLGTGGFNTDSSTELQTTAGLGTMSWEVASTDWAMAAIAIAPAAGAPSNTFIGYKSLLGVGN